jgi:putative Mg2+ transporter-C (MgtC) family protein
MPVLEPFIRILIAAILGGLIGIEREIREHTAGFRTHILVSVGSAAFTLASSYGIQGTSFDPNRISAQVVTGIGFLGAGAIIRYGISVRGLTTAASLWTVAAVGLLAAQGFYSAALITTGLTIFSLYLLRFLEDRLIYRRIARPISVRVHFRKGGFSPLTQVLSAIQQAHVTVKEMEVAADEDQTRTIHLLIQLPRTLDFAKLAALIAENENVQSVRMD